MDRPDTATTPRRGLLRGRQAAVGFILVSVWLDVLSLGAIIAVAALARGPRRAGSAA